MNYKIYLTPYFLLTLIILHFFFWLIRKENTEVIKNHCVNWYGPILLDFLPGIYYHLPRSLALNLHGSNQTTVNLSHSAVWRERERERKPTRCNNQMFIINFCLNMFRVSLCPSSGEQRPCITACVVLRCLCWMWLVAVVGRCVVGCEHTSYNTAPHNRYQPHPAEQAQYTTCSNTRSLFSWRWA